MKVHLTNPAPKEDAARSLTGVEQVVRAMHTFLPDHVELVDSPKGADVIASHIVGPHGVRPDVLHCHGLYPTGEWELPPWTWETNARIVDEAVQARQITVPSAWVGEQFARNMGFWPTIIPHGLFLDEWPEPKAGKRQGPILWNKNRLGDVCDPKPLETLANHASDLQFWTTFGTAQANVQVMGVVPYVQMRQMLYQATVYLATTKETFGIGILEALAAGTPVVGWRWGNVPDLVDHKKTGYIADPADLEDTLAGIRYCLDNWEELSANARQAALRYAWQDIIPQYVKVYEAALDKPASPRVTFVIPCHNYEQYVREAIQSVQRQTFADWECIVVDDGSTDSSVKVAKAAMGDDQRFQLVETDNQRVAAARNLGARMAKGEFLVFLDADDHVKPHFLEVLIPAMADRSIGVAYGGLDIQHGTGAPGASQWPGEWVFSQQLTGHNQVPSCCLIRKEAFFRTGGFRSHTIPAEDAELWTRIGLVGYRGIRVTDAPIYTYRVHQQSATATVRRQQKKEPDWLAWIPAAKGGPQPFASVAPSENLSHPVVSYDRPMVSIITPVGDGHEDLLERCIESVSAQLYPLWEHIVVDDTTEGGLSKRGVIPYSERYPWVQWRRKRKTGNVSAARNLGVKHSRGRWLLYLDADDELDRLFLYETVKIARQRPHSIIYTDWLSLPEGKGHRAEAWDVAKLKREALFVITYLHPREAYDAIGGFDESIPIWEDWDYTVRLAAAGYHGVHLPQPLFRYWYDGGTRRESCLQQAQALMPKFRERYATLEVQPAKDPPLTLTLGNLETLSKPQRVEKPDGQVLIEYVGSNLGARTYRTPLGRKYRFDGTRHNRQWVRADDVHWFVRMDTFKAVQT